MSNKEKFESSPLKFLFGDFFIHSDKRNGQKTITDHFSAKKLYSPAMWLHYIDACVQFHYCFHTSDTKKKHIKTSFVLHFQAESFHICLVRVTKEQNKLPPSLCFLSKSAIMSICL